MEAEEVEAEKVEETKSGHECAVRRIIQNKNYAHVICRGNHSCVHAICRGKIRNKI